MALGDEDIVRRLLGPAVKPIASGVCHLTQGLGRAQKDCAIGSVLAGHIVWLEIRCTFHAPLTFDRIATISERISPLSPAKSLASCVSTAATA